MSRPTVTAVPSPELLEGMRSAIKHERRSLWLRRVVTFYVIVGSTLGWVWLALWLRSRL